MYSSWKRNTILKIVFAYKSIECLYYYQLLKSGHLIVRSTSLNPYMAILKLGNLESWKKGKKESVSTNHSYNMRTLSLIQVLKVVYTWIFLAYKVHFERFQPMTSRKKDTWMFVNINGLLTLRKLPQFLYVGVQLVAHQTTNYDIMIVHDTAFDCWLSFHLNKLHMKWKPSHQSKPWKWITYSKYKILT